MSVNVNINAYTCDNKSFQNKSCLTAEFQVRNFTTHNPEAKEFTMEI